MGNWRVIDCCERRTQDNNIIMMMTEWTIEIIPLYMAAAADLFIRVYPTFLAIAQNLLGYEAQKRWLVGWLASSLSAEKCVHQQLRLYGHRNSKVSNYVFSAWSALQ